MQKNWTMLLSELENKLELVLTNISNIKEKTKIKEAYLFAKKSHDSQIRKSWEPYITHPLSVWLALWKRFQDIDLTIAWFLHDTVEDCVGVRQEDIYKKYWNNVWFIVDSVTKTEKKFLNLDIEFDDERDKMLYWWMHNIWCILVKLADREHNLETLWYMPKNKQVKKSFESQSLYLPLMSILEFNKDWITIERVEKLLLNYLEKNNINSSNEFKKILFNTCFHDFSESLFDLVYHNSNQVVWKIEDKKLFDWLLESGWFDSESVDLKKIETTWNWKFRANFIFKWGSTFDFSKWKISLSSSNFIS